MRDHNATYRCLLMINFTVKLSVKPALLMEMHRGMHWASDSADALINYKQHYLSDKFFLCLFFDQPCQVNFASNAGRDCLKNLNYTVNALHNRLQL